jgi:hypothetical protein
VYDDAQPDTINLATTIAGGRKALVTSASLLPRLTAAPYALPVLVDLRGQFGSKLAVYQALYNTYWPGVTHRVLIGLDPNVHKASLREYASALGAAVVWLDPRDANEGALLNSFLASMGAGNAYMGWWPEEGSGVEAGSRYGISTIASDWSTDLTVHSGMPRTINVKPMPPKPALQNTRSTSPSSSATATTCSTSSTTSASCGTTPTAARCRSAGRCRRRWSTRCRVR